MNFAPYQWRAGEGYLPPPGSMAMPLCPQPAYMPPFPGYQNLFGGNYGAYPYPAGPAIAIPPPRPATIPSTLPPPPAPKKDKPAAPPSTIAHSLAPSAAPTVRPGVHYMHAPTHTKLHIFNKAAHVWDAKYQTETLAFKIFKVSTQFTVKEIVERVIKGKPKDGDKVKWAVTEVFEAGGGEWMKGTTIEYGSDKAKGSLASMGWDERKGKEDIPPVWLVVHKV